MKLIELLKKEKLYGWKIITLEKERANLHYTKGFEEEAYLEGKRKDIEVTIYVDYGKEIGENTFPITSDDEEQLKQIIKDAIYSCSFTKKPKYNLLNKKEKSKKVQLVDEEIESALKNKKAKQLLESIAKKILTNFKKEKQVKLNGMELIIAKQNVSILTSKNISIKTEKTMFYVDSVITSYSGKNEEEHLGVETTCRIKDFNPEKFVKKYCQFARDVLISKSPKQFTGNVIIKENALHEFFVPFPPPTPLIVHSSAKLKYMGMSKFKIGDQITGKVPEGDLINITSNPLISFNLSSSQYDLDGIASKKITIIEKNRIKNFFGDLRHSQYIKIKPTGALGVIELSPGKKPEKNLQKEEHYEIQAFSWFNPNSLSGDFSAEIRLGYIVKNGKRIPFKGGTFTGNVFNLFNNAHLSKESIILNGYKGPKTILFKNATISGE